MEKWSCAGDLREVNRPLIAGAPKRKGRAMAAFNVFIYIRQIAPRMGTRRSSFLLSFAAAKTLAALTSATFPALSA